MADHVFGEVGEGACYADFEGCVCGKGGFGASGGGSSLERTGWFLRSAPDAEVGDGAVHVFCGSSE